MSSRPPFEFNLSAAADKKRKKTGRRGMSGAFDTADKPCDYPGCKAKAAFRAPKSPDLLDEFFWFCKDHIREYNLKWNFFNGNYNEYEADKRKRLGEDGARPHRVRYKALK